jgi:hypothetical protein
MEPNSVQLDVKVACQLTGHAAFFLDNMLITDADWYERHLDHFVIGSTGDDARQQSDFERLTGRLPLQPVRVVKVELS